MSEADSGGSMESIHSDGYNNVTDSERNYKMYDHRENIQRNSGVVAVRQSVVNDQTANNLVKQAQDRIQQNRNQYQDPEQKSTLALPAKRIKKPLAPGGAPEQRTAIVNAEATANKESQKINK